MPRVIKDYKGKVLNINMKISREKFNSLISKRVDKTKQAMKKALKDAKWKKEDIDIILLVGGSTRIPYVQEVIKDIMGTSPTKNIDPDLAVSIGAGEYAKVLNDGGTVIMDILPMSLGTSAVVDYMGQLVPNFYSEILPENWPLLKENDDDVGKFYMITDNQESVRFKVYQKHSGEESPFVDDNNPKFVLLEEFEVSGIPPKKAGEESITAKYSADTNGTLSVKITIDSTGKSIEKKLKLDVESNIPDSNIIDVEVSDSIHGWETASLARDYKTTIKLAEKEIKKSDNQELLSMVDELKKAILDNDKVLCEKNDTKINDFLFELT